MNVTLRNNMTVCLPQKYVSLLYMSSGEIILMFITLFQRENLDVSSYTAFGETARLGIAVEDNCVNQPTDTLEMWKAQSRKRTQTLPNRKSFLTSSFKGEKASNDKNNIFNSEFWKFSAGSPPSLLSPTEGHKRTLSQSLFRLIDIQRASTYDNVPTSQTESGECTSLPNTASSSSEKDFLSSQSPSLVHKETSSPATDPKDCCSGQEDHEILQLKKEMEMQKRDYEEQIKR